MNVAALAADLRAAARRADHRRLLVLAGERDDGVDAALDAVEGAAIPDDETTIVTVTDARGSLQLETNSNPGLSERIGWWLDRNTPEFSLGILQVPGLPTVPLDVSGAIGWVGPPQATPAPMIDPGASAVLAR